VRVYGGSLGTRDDTMVVGGVWLIHSRVGWEFNLVAYVVYVVGFTTSGYHTQSKTVEMSKDRNRQLLQQGYGTSMCKVTNVRNNSRTVDCVRTC
jgi:hypothetical protein